MIYSKQISQIRYLDNVTEIIILTVEDINFQIDRYEQGDRLKWGVVQHTFNDLCQVTNIPLMLNFT